MSIKATENTVYEERAIKERFKAMLGEIYYAYMEHKQQQQQGPLQCVVTLTTRERGIVGGTWLVAMTNHYFDRRNAISAPLKAKLLFPNAATEDAQLFEIVIQLKVED